jgi:hypothetical protein
MIVPLSLREEDDVVLRRFKRLIEIGRPADTLLFIYKFVI